MSADGGRLRDLEETLPNSSTRRAEEAKLAHADDYKGKSKDFDFSSSGPVTESFSNLLHSGDAGGSLTPPGKTSASFPDKPSSPLERAADCEVQAQRLVSLVEHVEESLRCVKLALSAADAVEQLLDDAAGLLSSARLQTNPASRKALASVYGEIVNQIDGLAFDAEFDGPNLATGDIINIAFENSGAKTLRIADVALTAASLGLVSVPADLAGDAEIVREMTAVEDARSTLATRKITLEAAMSVLRSRIDFSQAKLQSLRSTGEALVQGERAHLAIQDLAARRIAMESVSPSKLHGIRKDQVRNDNEESFSKEMAKARRDGSDANLSAERTRPADEKELEADLEELQTLILRLDAEPANDLDRFAMELARSLDEDSYPNLLTKYENGERDIFVSHLAKEYGPELVEKAKAQHANDGAFRTTADQYMRSYESGLEEAISGEAEPTDKIDSCLKTGYGWVYILLARAVGMV